jgi:flagellar biosynthesis chaperone FliJ
MGRMSTERQPTDVRVDTESQLMLRALIEAEEEWVRGLALRRAADLSENRQVFYRMERYLIPAGLVEESARESSEELRLFRLTTRGEQWVEEHAEVVFTPATREEIRRYAREGYEAGTSAKESVQNYRKKLNRVKNRVDAMRDEVASVSDQQEKDDLTLTLVSNRSNDTRERSKRNTDQIGALQDDVERLADAVEARAPIEQVDTVSEKLTSAEQRLQTLEAKQAGVARQQGETERARVQLRQWVEPARYLVIGAAVAYLIVLIATMVVAPDLMVGVIFAGIGALLGVAVGIAATIYAREATSLL